MSGQGFCKCLAHPCRICGAGYQTYVLVAWVEVQSRFNPATRKHEDRVEAKTCVWQKCSTKDDVFQVMAAAQRHLDKAHPQDFHLVLKTEDRADLFPWAREEIMRRYRQATA